MYRSYIDNTKALMKEDISMHKMKNIIHTMLKLKKDN